ncbi:SixA phosphatase family protein [Bizionia myxarmorum]|uniref:Histidine phosphatase family protein n=1 Tax=Bizionia myxarmorum TaxID=291186 RepID=A0A5D0QVK9_9FLAO|nr:histidine phosphatase family protein [Bizionia myxarmorum]TYB73162.1 histidine phosphatase family protein [Bizionia myxarmorum]
MKTLTLIRHAKSSWVLNLPDIQRPLNDRGFSDAHLVANHINLRQFQPDKLISSTAVRAKTTAEIFIDILKIPSKICEFNHELYDFSGKYLTFHIKNCSDSINHLMVFGHNEAITNFVNTFGDRFIENVPTSGLVTITFDVKSWKEIALGETVQVIFPKDLK